ncbi:MAG: RluA family pseudouridine synthase [Chlamydiales bacterium]
MKYSDKDAPSILYSDNHLLVVYKPAGICTQPGEGNSIEEWAKIKLKEETKKTGNIFLVPVHRLDKHVSGLVLFARSSKALSRLNEMMRERKIRKKYLARIEGRLPHDEGTLEHFLVHEEYRSRVAKEGEPDAKRALLTYRQVADALVEVELQTGRYHQIRAQLSAIGCPIVGDAKYGSKNSYPSQAIALQHIELAFTHPVTKQELLFALPRWKQAF